jgi:hypothetical protein
VVKNLDANQTKNSRSGLFKCNQLFDTVIRSSADPASIALETNFQLKLPALPSISGKRFIVYVPFPVVA